MGWNLTLYKGEVRQLHLQENDEITEDMYEEVLEEILIPRARRRAMHLLEKMDRSTRQLETKLREGGYPEPAIESAIAYVTSYHYLDDERLARSHIRFYQTSRSRMRMTQDLLKKGIDREIIDRLYGRRIGAIPDGVDRSFIAEEGLCSGECNAAGRSQNVSFPYAERLRIQ